MLRSLWFLTWQLWSVVKGAAVFQINTVTFERKNSRNKLMLEPFELITISQRLQVCQPLGAPCWTPCRRAAWAELLRQKTRVLPPKCFHLLSPRFEPCSFLEPWVNQNKCKHRQQELLLSPFTLVYHHGAKVAFCSGRQLLFQQTG